MSEVLEHNFEALAVPPEPWVEVVPNLYMGGCLQGGDLRRFDVVVSLSRSGAFAAGAKVPAGVEHVLATFGDDNRIPEFVVGRAVLRARQALDRGLTVLVRCQAGLNRSGLVVARVLVEHHGFEPSNAIRHLRAVRSPYALFNAAFEAYVLGVPFECEACDRRDHRCEVCGWRIVHGLQVCRRHHEDRDICAYPAQCWEVSAEGDDHCPRHAEIRDRGPARSLPAWDLPARS